MIPFPSRVTQPAFIRYQMFAIIVIALSELLVAADEWTERPTSSPPSSTVIRTLDDSQLNPRTDGWETEALSEAVGKVLGQLARQTEQALQDPDLSAFETATLSISSESQYRNAYDDGRIRVQQFDGIRDATSISLPTGIEQLLAPWQGRVEHAKFKVIGINVTENKATTRQILELSGKSSDQFVEMHAHTTAEWALPDAKSPPILISLRMEAAQRIVSRIEQRHLFSDLTPSVFSAVPEYRSQLRWGIDHWLERLDRMLTDQFGHHGLAVGDVNGDGRDDIYLCQPGGLPNLLLLQQRDGTVRSAVGSGTEILDLSRSALLVDLDNDSDQDLVVATANQVLIWANDGQARFKLTAKNRVRDANSLSAVDIDLDGDLDLYVCVYSGDGGASRGSPTPIPIHDARNGGRNVLLRNEQTTAATWRFTDATTELGLDTQNDRWSYAASWEDFDNDGDADLYVANDFGRNNLYRNDRGRFVDVSSSAGLDEAAFGMSVSWADFDRDGLMDVYVSNMFSGAGNRIVPQPQFQPEASPSIRKQLQYAARGNSLFRNMGDGTFDDVSEMAQVTFGRWAWGSLFADLNNDGWDDLLVGNGFVTREDTDDL